MLRSSRASSLHKSKGCDALEVSRRVATFIEGLAVARAWLTTDQRRRARIPPTVRFQEKWRLALTLLQQVRASGLTVTAVVADAEFGNNATLRRTLHRAQLPYALGVSSGVKVFLGTPVLQAPTTQ